MFIHSESRVNDEAFRPAFLTVRRTQENGSRQSQKYGSLYPVSIQCEAIYATARKIERFSDAATLRETARGGVTLA